MDGLTIRPSTEAGQKFCRHFCCSRPPPLLVRRRRPHRHRRPQLVERLLVRRLDLRNHPEHRDPVFLEALEEVVDRPERSRNLRLDGHDGGPEFLESGLHFIFKDLSGTSHDRKLRTKKNFTFISYQQNPNKFSVLGQLKYNHQPNLTQSLQIRYKEIGTVNHIKCQQEPFQRQRGCRAELLAKFLKLLSCCLPDPTPSLENGPSRY